MGLEFYKQAATPNRIDKSGFLTSMGTISNVKLLENTDLMHPTFIVKTNPVVYNSNYCLYDVTCRYYYIDRVTAMSGGRIAIECTCDVLYTFRAELMDTPCWVDVASQALDSTPPPYDMLHNDYPFRQDYDVMGVNLTGGLGWTCPLDTPDGLDSKHIFLVLK